MIWSLNGCVIATVLITTGAIVWPEWRRVRAMHALETAYRLRSPPNIVQAIGMLAETHDVRVVPFLIDSLYYVGDAEVPQSALDALCVLAHRSGGFVASDAGEDTWEQWSKEIDYWKDWYKSIQTNAESAEDELESASKKVDSWMQPIGKSVDGQIRAGRNIQ